MAFTNYIQQIKDTGGTTHDLVDTSASHYVKGTQTSSTNAWTGALPDGVTAYYDGLSIDYFLPYAGTSTAATLNLGGKGAKPVYVGNGTGGVTTHFPVNSVIHLTYIVNSALNSGNGCWKVDAYYNTNDDYRVRTVARGTTKAYVLGTTTAPTSSNQNVTSVSETGVYFDTTAATLVATTFKGALTGTASGNLTSSSTLDATKLSGTIPTSCYTNTKNTAGSTDTSSKIFLIGATSQAANPQTYSHDTAYVGTDGCLYSGGSKVLTAHQTATATPTANTVSKFDGSAHMNSTDMSTSDVSSFINGLAISTSSLIEVVSLDTKAILYRIGNIRILVLNEYVGANSTLHIDSADAPSITISAPAIVRNSSSLAIRIGFVTVSNTSPYYVQRYFAGTYNASGEGLSNIASTDRISSVIVWSI